MWTSSPRTNSLIPLQSFLQQLDLKLNGGLTEKTRVNFGHTFSAAVLTALKDNQYVNILVQSRGSYRVTI